MRAALANRKGTTHLSLPHRRGVPLRERRLQYPEGALLSLIIPVYKNEENLPRLLRELEVLAERFECTLEVVFVVDGSPDNSMRILGERLPVWPVRSALVELSRNFGSFSAIVAGLRQGTGEYFAVLAADLQEPPELIVEFYH